MDISPGVVNLPPSQTTAAPVPKRSFFSPKVFFLLGGFLVLLVGLGVGVFLVQQKRNQDLRSKAAGCNPSGWSVGPSPADGATGVSLSPNFKWDWEVPSVTCPGSWSGYANVYLWNCAAANDSCLIGFGSRSSTTDPIYEIPASEVHPYYAPGKPDYSKSVAPLLPNTQYWWYATLAAGGVVHFQEGKHWTFTTGSAPPQTHKECRNNACVSVDGAGADNCPNNCQPPPPPPGTAACQMVSADKDLASIKLNDTVTFTGFGVTSADSEIIDQVNFIILKDGTEASNSAVPAVRDTTKDSEFNGKAWKATQTFIVPGTGSYSVRIRVHWKNQDVWKE